ncbi:hypothetical protein GCM10027414_07140 [Humibacter ginsengiterrae]
MTTARQYFIDEITPLLPTDWRVDPFVDTLDNMDRMTVLLKITDLEKAIGVPNGSYLTTADVILIAPQSGNIVTSEDALDEALLTLLPALDSAHVRWTKASKATFTDLQALGYSIAVQFVTSADTPESPTP